MFSYFVYTRVWYLKREKVSDHLELELQAVCELSHEVLRTKPLQLYFPLKMPFFCVL